MKWMASPFVIGVLLFPALAHASATPSSPPDAWATVVVDADGYANWTLQLKGAPADHLSICLALADGQGD